MGIDEISKVFLMPWEGSEKETFRIVNLPNGPNKVSKPFLVKGHKVYELIEVKGNNPFETKKQILLNNDIAVKSFIFEGRNAGFVLQNPNLIVGTQFNITFLLISIMFENDSFSKRYLSLEDVIDTIESICGTENQWPTEIPEQSYHQGLINICDTIEENHEHYYKFTIDKAVSFIYDKVMKLNDYIKKGNNSIWVKIKTELSDNVDLVPQDILDLSILKHAVDFICGTYLPAAFKDLVLCKEGTDYAKLEYFKEDINYKARLAVEESMSILASSNGSVKGRPRNVKKKPMKKEGKKVAVGKGALDGFFKPK